MFTLPIERKWLYMMVAGVKREEYREIKPYWTTRFQKLFADGKKHCVRFRAGYQKDSEYGDFLVSLRTGTGRAEWGAVEGKRYYVLYLHEIASSYVKDMPTYYLK